MWLPRRGSISGWDCLIGQPRPRKQKKDEERRKHHGVQQQTTNPFSWTFWGQWHEEEKKAKKREKKCMPSLQMDAYCLHFPLTLELLFSSIYCCCEGGVELSYLDMGHGSGSRCLKVSDTEKLKSQILRSRIYWRCFCVECVHVCVVCVCVCVCRLTHTIDLIFGGAIGTIWHFVYMSWHSY